MTSNSSDRASSRGRDKDKEAGQDGDAELAAGYAEDVADLRAILRLIETGARHEAAEAIDCLDTLVRDQIPIRLYDAVVPGS